MLVVTSIDVIAYAMLGTGEGEYRVPHERPEPGGKTTSTCKRGG